MEKKGAEKYYVIISFIMGIVIIAMVFYFFFMEYFTAEEMDWDNCRQSIVLRSGQLNNAMKTVQEQFPFKCKTQVINIGVEKTPIQILDIIANATAACQYTYGEGKIKLYADNWFTKEINCFVCARIHFDKEIYGPILLGPYLATSELKPGVSYFDYLFPHELYGDGSDEIINQRKELWNFDAANGDILITMAYQKGAFYAITKKNEGWGLNAVVYQPKISPTFLKNVCTKIETIPA